MDSFIILTGLKCIFQKQLPKMPKDYIARLVYDRSHLSIAIVKHPLEVVGCVISELCFFVFGEKISYKVNIEIGASRIDRLKEESSPRLCSVPFRLISRSRVMVHILCLI